MEIVGGGEISEAVWNRLLLRQPGCGDRCPLYDELVAPPIAPDGSFVLGRIAQSVDGRIATENGASRWISGPADILHTHRLRALFDAVVVGAGTVAADDPQLTTRACSGPSPVRVILDPRRRLGDDLRVFTSGPPTLVVCADDCDGDPPGRAELVRLPRGVGGFDVRSVLAALAARGLRRVFVEGGGSTVSRFLAAGALDRIHVTIAPLLLGSGIPAFSFPGVMHPQDGLALQWTVHRLGDDLLLDVPLNRACPADRAA